MYRREEMPMKTKFKVIIAVILAVVISIGSISAYKYITSPKEERASRSRPHWKMLQS